MTGIITRTRLKLRHRKAVTLALAGWLSLSLVLVFWPCCETLAGVPAPVSSMSSGEHSYDHEHAPPGPIDPCRTWLDSTDAALSTFPDILASDFELKFGPAATVITQNYSRPAASLPGRMFYDASPPSALPLYLRLQHLLI